MQVLRSAIEARKSGRRRHLAGVRNAAGTGPEVLSVSLHQKMLWLASPFLLLTILQLINSPTIGASLGSATLALPLPLTLDLTSISRKASVSLERRNRTRQKLLAAFDNPAVSLPQTRADKGRQDKTRQARQERTRPNI